ncbi:MAG: dihydrolipoyl dehydrogenase [Clostridiales bacterium]|nr:dihydrolipoyl dehydrogenase [Clostridiales bacterium]
MADVIIMPKLGYNMDEGQLVKWCKKEGENVAKGEVLFEINTDKTTMPVEATADAVVLKLLIQEGDYAPVFTPIAVVGDAGEDADAALATYRGEEPKAEATPKMEQEKAVEAPKVSGRDYEVAVIGGGPGGYVAAIKAAQAGKKTVIIEKEHYGGTCLNIGCIPTKTLIKTVNVYEEVKNASKFAVEGVEPSAIRINVDKMQARKNAVVKQLVTGVKGLLKGNKVTTIQAEASFIDKNTIKAGDQTITADYIIIATGSETFMAPFIAREGDTNIITSKEALSINYIPESISIIGGGVIGIEFAYIFAMMGTKVYVLELMDKILPMVDAEVSDMARKKLEKLGVTFYTGAKVKKISGKNTCYELDGKESSIETELVLMSVGRVAEYQALNVSAASIEVYKKGIKTDEYLRTNVPNIYAIGDVNGKSMLAHTASHEGMIAVENICGKQSKISYDFIPSCIYLEPEIACIGMTEAQAREKCKNVKIGKFPLVGNGKALVEGESTGMIKVIIDGDLGEILGVHIFGVHATDMISEIAVAMTMEATAQEIIESVHPHPTVAEIIPEAFMAATTGKAVHVL